MAAFVGHSGAGKSTILNLLPRFYDPDTGIIKIDNQDIKELTIDSVRSSIALVSQEPILYGFFSFLKTSLIGTPDKPS